MHKHVIRIIAVSLVFSLLGDPMTVSALSASPVSVRPVAAPASIFQDQALTLALTSTDHLSFKKAVIFLRSQAARLRRSSPPEEPPTPETPSPEARPLTSIEVLRNMTSIYHPSWEIVNMARQDYLIQLAALQMLKHLKEPHPEGSSMPSEKPPQAVPVPSTPPAAAVPKFSGKLPSEQPVPQRDILQILRVIDETFAERARKIDDLLTRAGDKSLDLDERLRYAVQAQGLFQRTEEDTPDLYIRLRYDRLADVVRHTIVAIRQEKERHTAGVRAEFRQDLNQIDYIYGLDPLPDSTAVIEAPLRRHVEQALSLPPPERENLFNDYDALIRNYSSKSMEVLEGSTLRTWRLRHSILAQESKDQLLQTREITDWLESLGGSKRGAISKAHPGLLSEDLRLEKMPLVTLDQLLFKMFRTACVVSDWDNTIIKRSLHTEQAQQVAMKRLMYDLLSESPDAFVLEDAALVRLALVFSASHLVKEMGLHFHPDKIITYQRRMEVFRDQEKERTTPEIVAGWPEFTDILKFHGIPLSVMTPNRAVYSEIKNFGIRKWIQRIYISNEHEGKIPALRTELIKVGLRRKSARRRAVMMSDNPLDLREARSLGMRTIAVIGPLLERFDETMKQRLTELYASADYVIEDFQDPMIYKVWREDPSEGSRLLRTGATAVVLAFAAILALPALAPALTVLQEPRSTQHVLRTLLGLLFIGAVLHALPLLRKRKGPQRKRFYPAVPALLPDITQPVTQEDTDIFIKFVAARIRNLSIDKQMTVVEAAEAAQVTQPHLAVIESGTSDLQFATILRIAQGYNIAIEELLKPEYSVEVDRSRHFKPVTLYQIGKALAREERSSPLTADYLNSTWSHRTRRDLLVLSEHILNIQNGQDPKLSTFYVYYLRGLELDLPNFLKTARSFPKQKPDRSKGLWSTARMPAIVAALGSIDIWLTMGQPTFALQLQPETANILVFLVIAGVLAMLLRNQKTIRESVHLNAASHLLVFNIKTVALFTFVITLLSTDLFHLLAVSILILITWPFVTLHVQPWLTTTFLPYWKAVFWMTVDRRDRPQETEIADMTLAVSIGERPFFKELILEPIDRTDWGLFLAGSGFQIRSVDLLGQSRLEGRVTFRQTPSGYHIDFMESARWVGHTRRFNEVETLLISAVARESFRHGFNGVVGHYSKRKEGMFHLKQAGFGRLWKYLHLFKLVSRKDMSWFSDWFLSPAQALALLARIRPLEEDAVAMPVTDRIYNRHVLPDPPAGPPDLPKFFRPIQRSA